MKIEIGFLSALILSFGNSAWCQSPSAAVPPKLSLRYLPPATAAAGAANGGDSATLSVHVEIAPGWHINSETPLDSFLVASHLDAVRPGWEFGKPKFPKPTVEYSQVMAGNLSLYTGTFDVTVPAKKSAEQSGSKTTVSLRYQACNNSMCLPPKTVTAELDSK